MATRKVSTYSVKKLRDIAADTGFLWDNVTALRDTIKRHPVED